jgi:hypothetical protein
VVGPIVALLKVRSDFGFGEFVRERVFFAACDFPCAITEIGAKGGERLQLCSFVSCSDIVEEVGVGNDIELCRSAEKVEFTVLVWMSADVQRGKAKWKFGSKCT